MKPPDKKPRMKKTILFRMAFLSAGSRSFKRNKFEIIYYSQNYYNQIFDCYNDCIGVF